MNKKITSNLYYYKTLLKANGELTPKQQAKYEEYKRIYEEQQKEFVKPPLTEEEEIEHAKQYLQRNKERIKQRYNDNKNNEEWQARLKQYRRDRYMKIKETKNNKPINDKQ